jgi:hypothetical protein
MSQPSKDPPSPKKPARKYVPPQAISLSDAEVGFGGSCSLGSYANGSCNNGGTAGGKCHTGISAGGCGQGTGPNSPQQLNDQHW